MKKLFALLLAVIMVLGMVACAETTPDATTTKPQGDTNTTGTPTTTTEPAVKVEFPLKEELKLVLVSSVRNTVIDLQKNLAQNKLWQDLYKRTNVRIEVRTLTAGIDSLAAMMQTGDYGDIIITQGMNETVLSDLIATEKLLVLNDYVNNPGVMPNLIKNVWEECPEAKGNFTAPNGNLYVLGTYSAEKSTYLENMCWINKTWLEKANMDVPETMDDLEKFFDWVMKNDPNGNGKQDELPYGCYPSGGSMIEALLGCYGIPTKDAANENYIYIEDGEVVFVPTTDAYKEFLTRLNKWMTNGWMYDSYFLGSNKDNENRYKDPNWRDNGQPETVAFYTGNSEPPRNTGKLHPDPDNRCEYVPILPPTVEGYEVRWYMHPGYMGNKGCFAIASNCEYPEIALAFMDQFYSNEVTERFSIGERGTDWVKVDADGKISAVALTNDEQAVILETENNRLNQIFANMPTAITKHMLENVYTTTESTLKKREALAFYEEVLNEDIWPRPYIDPEDTNELNELRTDIMSLVNEYRAGAVKGTKNLTSDWDKLQADLKQADVETFVEILQGCWDNFIAGKE